MQLDKQRAITELGIPAELYEELLHVFVDQTEKALGELQQHIGQKNFEEIVKSAHFIKGSAANLRIAEIFELSRIIEMEARGNKDLCVIGPAAEKLGAEFREFKTIVG